MTNKLMDVNIDDELVLAIFDYVTKTNLPSSVFP